MPVCLNCSTEFVLFFLQLFLRPAAMEFRVFRVCGRLYGLQILFRGYTTWLDSPMGNRRENERRVGVTRPGLAERARKEREREAARERQRQCRLQTRERAALEAVDMQAEEADDMDADDSSLGRNRREVRRSAAAILSFVEDTLARHNDRDKEAVLRSVWSSSVTTVNFPITKRVSSELQARENIVSGLVQSLSEVKNSRSRAHLVTKHAILTAAMSSGI
jgi:hypothetical protein